MVDIFYIFFFLTRELCRRIAVSSEEKHAIIHRF